VNKIGATGSSAGTGSEVAGRRGLSAGAQADSTSVHSTMQAARLNKFT
jgi:hypothetical protein